MKAPEACPICGSSESGEWLAENNRYLFDCEACSTFTITAERVKAFTDAWRAGDREILMCLESLSSYLRRAGDDDERDVTEDTWLALAIEGQAPDDEFDLD